MDYFSEDELVEMIAKLHHLTESGRLSWKQFNDSDYSFTAVVGSSVFTVASRDEDDMAPHVFGVYQVADGKLRELQQFDSVDVSQRVAGSLSNLYDLVKRGVLKIDLIAKNVLADLDRLAGDPPF